MDTKKLKTRARSLGADLIGIAPIERFKTLSADQSPLSIFPECKSVIVLAKRILRGSIRGVEEGTNFDSTYRFFGFSSLENNFLPQTVYDLTCFIESQNLEAVPLFGYRPEGMAKGQPVAEGKPAPNVIVDINFAAAAAGLGQLGLGDFFLTPQYGPRQRFAMILTDAILESDELKTYDFCQNCGDCAKACPLGAINIKTKKTVGPKDVQTQIATIDYAICRQCPNGAMIEPGRGSIPDRCAAACARQCLVHLEQNGKLENKFENTFRKRQPWTMPLFSQTQKPIY